MTEVELIGGPEPGPVTLVDYDAAWADPAFPAGLVDVRREPDGGR